MANIPHLRYDVPYIPKTVLLYSGGMDSFLLNEFIKSMGDDEPIKVWYDIGQQSAEQERKVIEESGAHIFKIPWLDRFPDLLQEKPAKDGKRSSSGKIIIPARNLGLIVHAASMFIPDFIYIGGMYGEENSEDKNLEFYEDTERLLTKTLKPFLRKGKLQVLSPFQRMKWSKLDTVKWFVETYPNRVKDLINTFSCLEGYGKEIACGKCVDCMRRTGIFLQLGVQIDDMEYFPPDTDFGKEYIQKCRDGLYPDCRVKEIETFL